MTQGYPPSPLPEYPEERGATPEFPVPDMAAVDAGAGYTDTSSRGATEYDAPEQSAPPAGTGYADATAWTTEPPATDTDSDQSKADVAKEQAASVGQGAAGAGQHVASVAKDQAQNVVAEAGTQARNLVDQTRSELTSQAAAQQQRLASGLRALGDELHSMSQHSGDDGVATDLARQASGRSHDIASWLDDREPGRLLRDVEDFARRRPAAFLAIAAGAGLMVGRLGRGLKDSSGEQDPTAGGDSR